jgi:hypothetical protein
MDKIQSSDMPEWALATNGAHYGPITLFLSDGQKFSGKGSISKDFPFKIRCDRIPIKISPLKNIIMSVDSMMPKSHLFAIEVINCSLKIDSDDEEDSPLGSDNYYDILQERKRNRSIFSSIKGNFVEAVKRSSSVLTSSSNSIATTSASNLVSNNVRSNSNQGSYIVISSGGYLHQTKTISVDAASWNDFFLIDFENFDNKNSVNFMDLFLFSGIEGREELIKQKYLSFNTMLPENFNFSLQNNPESDNQIEIALDSVLGNLFYILK